MRIEVGHAHHFEWLKGIVVAVFALNVLDGVLTLYWIVEGRAREANPLMAGLIHLDPLVFMLGKLALVVLGSILLWRLRRWPAAVVAIFGVFLVYYCLTLYHLRAMNVQLLRRWLA
jgi:hypothetical protein